MARFTLTVEVAQPRRGPRPSPAGPTAAPPPRPNPPEGAAGHAPATVGPDLGSCFRWPVSSPGSLAKVVLMGLISLIPIIGPLTLLGWMMDSVGQLTYNQRGLPWPRMAQVGLGLRVVAAQFLYFSGCIASLWIAGSVATGEPGHREWTAAAWALGSLAVLLLPATLEAIGRGRPLDLVAVLSAVARRPGATVRGALLIVPLALVIVVLAAHGLSALGVFGLSLRGPVPAPSWSGAPVAAVLTTVGVLLAMPYAAAVMAGALYRYVVGWA